MQWYYCINRNIALKGFLFKRGSSKFKMWNRRYFVMKDNQLQYQKKGPTKVCLSLCSRHIVCHCVCPCVYVCVSLCMPICVCVCHYVCPYVCVCMFVSLCMPICVCMCVVCVFLCMAVFVVC